jgi:hypothetical protein
VRHARRRTQDLVQHLPDAAGNEPEEIASITDPQSSMPGSPHCPPW